MNPMFEQENMVHALDRAATMIGFEMLAYSQFMTIFPKYNLWR
jgi:hypothetical protein